MLNKFTIVGLIIGSIISILGASSMIGSLSSPNEIQEDSATFAIGGMDKIQFNAPKNSSQSYQMVVLEHQVMQQKHLQQVHHQ